MNTNSPGKSPLTKHVPMDMYAAWILILTWATLSGWLLSLAGAVNRTGYALACLPLLIWGIHNRHSAVAGLVCDTGRHVRRFARRSIKRPLPAVFAITTLAATIGGLLYAPNNYDFLTYRFARMLHWRDAGHWHWIHTANFRQNISGTGMEWTMMPSLALTYSSRLFFLLNLVSYLLMPGLVFSVLTQLGIARRTSWFWMWIIPAAYCYAATVGGVGNDTFGAVLALTALHFGCRATQQGGITSLWLGFLAAGLMTAVKASNLPLLLPFLAAARPAMAAIKTRWIQTMGIACVALAISFAPTAVLNYVYTGDWTGDPSNQDMLRATSPKTALLGNSLLLAMGCLAPPVLPQASAWTAHIQNWLPSSLRDQLKAGFPRFMLKFNELSNEEHAGLGCGVTILLVTALGVGLFTRRRKSPKPCRWSVMLGGIIALIAFGSVLTAGGTIRLLSPYYPLVIASVLALPGTERVTRMRWWRIPAVLVSLSALLIIILTPSRPLWPAQTVTKALLSRNPESRLLARISSVYSVYGERADALAPARALLPDGAHVIGFIQSGDDPEISLWLPFGRQHVIHIVGREMSNLPWLDKMGIQAIVARRTIVERQCGSVEKWIADINGELIATLRLTVKVADGEQEWCIAKRWILKK